MAANGQRIKLLLVCAAALLTFGCGKYGNVEQGRVIAFDQQKGEVTIIRDSGATRGKPQYDVLPPVSVKIPSDPTEMGPSPAAGKRLLFDTNNKKIVVFDSASGSIKTIIYTPLMEASDVSRDDPRVKGIQFPVIDRKNKTITIYSSRDRKLVMFKVTDDYLVLSNDTWKAGDDVRYYYKEPGQALRMMNVTATNLSRK